MKLEFRTLFISDVHLGCMGSRASELATFLKHVRCERLYLVGDILDLWALRQRWRWPLSHNQVVRRILKFAKRGTHVVYVPGNHDDALRQYAGLDVGGVRVATRAVHRLADGRSLLITHGDEFDLVVRHSRLTAALGGWAYDRLVLVNRWINAARGFAGMGPLSFSRAIKLRVKGACTFMADFESLLLADATQRGHDGVICGHIHNAVLRETIRDGRPLLYANCGDWIEKPTALVEHADGRLELLDVEALLREHALEPAGSDLEPIASEVEC